MSFLSPWLLLLGLAAAIPLLLHLLRRRVGNRMDFPAVRYLLRAEQENRRTMRLRNLLLMLLRVAIVIMLSIAAARPIGRMIGAGHAPAAMAIVIDNSMSSGVVVDGRSMLDRFKSAAIDLVGTIDPADNVWLVTADGAVAGGSASSVRDAIAALSPSAADTDLPAASRRAMGLASAASQSARSVVVFTDGQRVSWPPTKLEDDRVNAVIFAPRAAMPDNHSITFAEARPHRWSPRGEVALRVSGRDSLTYRVTLAGRTFARGTAAPGVEVVIHTAPPERGWLGGSVDIAPDELAADDIRYFAAWIGPAPGVHATAGAGEFLVAALDALRASGRIAAGAAVAAGPADEVTALPALIVPPSDPVRLGAANRALERLGIPWRFGKRVAQPVDASMRDGSRVPVTDRYELVPQSGAVADTVAAVGASPWIVAGPKYVLTGSPMSAPATGLPVQANFIPWLASVIADRLSGDPGTVIAATPGTWVRRPPGVNQLERSDGSMVALGDSVRVPSTAGVHFFLSSGRRAGAIVVNPPARESQLERMSVSQIEQLIPKSSVQTGDADALTRSTFTAAASRSLLAPVLAAVLALLIAETLMVAAGRRKFAGLGGGDS